jgi:hypothetical protein
MVERARRHDHVGVGERELIRLAEVERREVDPAGERLQHRPRPLTHRRGRVHPRASRVRKSLEQLSQEPALSRTEIHDAADLDPRVDDESGRDPPGEDGGFHESVRRPPCVDVLTRAPGSGTILPCHPSTRRTRYSQAEVSCSVE